MHSTDYYRDKLSPEVASPAHELLLHRPKVKLVLFLSRIKPVYHFTRRLLAICVPHEPLLETEFNRTSNTTLDV